VEPKNTAQFEKVFENFLLTKIGKVTAEYELSIQVEKEKIIELKGEQMSSIYENSIKKIMDQQ
ncbi:MAG: hypothetical protein PHV30_06650, partial [Candidatus Margulisbacteria bacterium]|nr:hypothetical protein [Candidatus Margulisiibacteriota bacterium]